MQAKKHEYVVGGVPPVNNRSKDRAWFGKVFSPIHMP